MGLAQIHHRCGCCSFLGPSPPGQPGSCPLCPPRSPSAGSVPPSLWWGPLKVNFSPPDEPPHAALGPGPSVVHGSALIPPCGSLAFPSSPWASARHRCERPEVADLATGPMTPPTDFSSCREWLQGDGCHLSSIPRLAGCSLACVASWHEGLGPCFHPDDFHLDVTFSFHLVLMT